MVARTANGHFRPNARSMRSNEREALATAIASHNAAKDRVTATESALRHARRSAYDHRDAITAAKAAVNAAHAAYADGLVSAARGGTPPSETAIADAERTVANLEQKSGHFDAAIAVLEKDLAAAQNDVPFRSHRVEEAVHSVMRCDPNVRKLYMEFAEVGTRYATLWALVSEVLPSADIRPDGVPAAAVEPDYTVTKSWFEYVERLKVNADATYEPPPHTAHAPAHEGRAAAGL